MPQTASTSKSTHIRSRYYNFSNFKEYLDRSSESMGITPPPQMAKQGRGRTGADYNHHASDMLLQPPIISNQDNFGNIY